MPKLEAGPLHDRWGPYIRNLQTVADGIFLVEGQRGVKGTGKVWNPMLLRRNPLYDPNGDNWHNKPPYQEVGVVKLGTGYRGAGMFKVTMWVHPTYNPKASHNVRRYLEAYFETEKLAVEFMIRNVEEFVKP